MRRKNIEELFICGDFWSKNRRWALSLNKLRFLMLQNVLKLTYNIICQPADKCSVVWLSVRWQMFELLGRDWQDQSQSLFWIVFCKRFLETVKRVKTIFWVCIQSSNLLHTSVIDGITCNKRKVTKSNSTCRCKRELGA